MTKEKETVAVIGAGIIGVNCALQLQAHGYNVTLIDKAGIGEGCSKGNAGHFATEQVFPLAEFNLLWQLPKLLLDPLGPVSISPKYLPTVLPWFFKFIGNMYTAKRHKNMEALKALNKHAIELYKPLLKAANAEHLLTSKGSLLVFETTNINTVTKHFNTYKNAGVAVKLLDRQQTLLLEPSIHNKVNYSLYFTDVGHTVDPYLFCQSLANYAFSLGTVFKKLAISKINYREKNIELANNSEKLVFDKVVIATGAWSKVLAEQLGYNLPMEYERGYHLDIPEINKDHALTRPVASAERKFIITPMTHGLRLAGTVEFAGLDLPANMKRANSLYKNALNVLSNISPYDCEAPTDEQRWMGFRPSMPDSLPVIGTAPLHNNIYFAVGHQHLGLTLGAVTGKLITQLVNGEATYLDISPFSLERFNKA
ncbi:NAD(P)/FAD-dependent oxidoreductase [Thalassotalea piscium]|uniref:D-amino-acid dehydrogenase n=1 Tax=Thalassotalea piscium TaxID=1230533 RepID=A0A7X0NK65_9GAMM|nr:FAD-dependent oxidoreductase [Thalassotalea piscium]MBB6544915.1 D-amino-acid dehydrogenase [Thalassotalea piscium]